jgi:glutamate formiminotransferase/glutamate formiminotransferase/formiminotetrahydrofolate cyclodeaminase
MPAPTLLAVPNVSEGRDQAAIARVAEAFAPTTPRQGDDHGDAGHKPVRLLDTHSDRDHHRSVYTLVGQQGQLCQALVEGAREATATIDLTRRRNDELNEPGKHPHVGAIDVVPLVYLDRSTRGAACAEALTTAEQLANELDLPIFLYGELTGDDPATKITRADIRRGGLATLAERMSMNDQRHRLNPDFGPDRPHPTAGATLVSARPPLVAFNLQLAPPATMDDARRIAAAIREHPSQSQSHHPDTRIEGIPGLRAIAIELTNEDDDDNNHPHPTPQVSMNVERPFDTPLAEIVQAVRRLAPVASAELVGLAPRSAFDGFPDDLPIPGFDPARHLIENAIGSF